MTIEKAIKTERYKARCSTTKDEEKYHTQISEWLEELSSYRSDKG